MRTTESQLVARWPAPALAGWARVVLISTLALGWAILMRLPYIGVSGPDDGFYSEVALLWRQGILPYVGAFDVKPPGIFAALALSQSLFGVGFAALRAVGILGDATTMALMLFLAMSRGSPVAGLFACLLYGWFSHALVGDDCYSLLIALTTLAMTIGLSAGPPVRKALLAGLAIGAAGLVKQTAVFEGAALIIILLRGGGDLPGRVRIVLAYAAGVAMLALVCLAWFAAEGGLFALIHDTVVIALQRPGAQSDGVSFLGGLAHFWVIARGIAPLLLIAGLTVLQRRSLGSLRPDIDALGIWLLASVAGVIVQHALLATYLAALAPPMLLLAGFGLAARLKDAKGAIAIGLIGFALIEVAGVAKSTLDAAPEDMTAIDGIAAAIEAARPTAADRLYIIGASPKSEWIYTRAGVRPVTPFLIPSQQACAFPGVGPGLIVDSFAMRPRFVVTDAEPKSYGCEVAGVASLIRSSLDRDYRLVTRIEGSDAGYNLYEIAAR